MENKRNERGDEDFAPYLSHQEKLDHEKAEKKYGSLIEKSVGSSMPHLNRIGTAYFYSMQLGKMVYIRKEDKLYRYKDSQGVWEAYPDDLLFAELMDHLVLFAKRVYGLDIGYVCTRSLVRDLVTYVKRFCSQEGFFDREPGVYYLHCQNCILVYNSNMGKFEELPLNTDKIHSRAQLNVSFNPQSHCPRFLDELLGPVLNDDEIEVTLQYMGLCFLGFNLAEKILFMTGLAGAGKSTTVNLIELIVGRENVTELRTQCLHGWYETNRYVGKNLLCAKDAPANFLKNQGASKLKALTGKDVLTTEAKHSNAVTEIEGSFNVIVTSNCDQPIMIQDDREAWERRVLIVKFKNHKPDKPIRDFERLLLQEEGPGILNEVIKRLEVILQAGGRISPSQTQQDAINNLLEQSQSVETFLKERVEAIEPPKDENLRSQGNLTSEELYTAYLDFCRQREWKPIPTRKFYTALTDLMPQAFNRYRQNDIKRNETSHRGYYAIKLKQLPQNNK